MTKADKLTTIMCLLSRNSGSVNLVEPKDPYRDYFT